MCSSHSSPIKRYNYERSAYRWLLARHPKQFEKEGLDSTSLERAPLARQHIYHTNWPGAKILVRCIEGRYERTAFFEKFINRGLLSGTRFAADHLVPEEKQELGILEDAATGKFYLSHYGLAPPAEPPTFNWAGDCVPGCCNGSKKRCHAHTEAQRKLWQAVSAAVGPELSTKNAKREVTVTKAVKSTGCRTVMQVIIEIDTGAEGSPDAIAAAAAATSSNATTITQLFKQEAADQQSHEHTLLEPCVTTTSAVVSRGPSPLLPSPPSSHEDAFASTSSVISADESDEPVQPPSRKRMRATVWATTSAPHSTTTTTYFKEGGAALRAAAAARLRAESLGGSGGSGAADASAAAALHRTESLGGGGAADAAAAAAAAALIRDSEYAAIATRCDEDDFAHWSEAKLLDDLDVDILSSLF